MKGSISLPIILAVAGIMGSGFLAWNDVTTDVQANTTSIAKNDEQNDERYEDLKEGQRHIQDLLEQLLLRERDEDEGDGGS